MDRRVDSHRDFVGVLGCDLLVHVEEVAVLASHHVFAIPLDGGSEVEINRQARRPDTKAGIAPFLRCAGRDVAWGEIAIRRIPPFEVVIAFVFRNLIG